MTKANPAQYCIWCEEKLATKEQFPHCSSHCKIDERAQKARDERKNGLR